MTAYSEKNLFDRIIDRHGQLVKLRTPFDPARKVIVERFRPDLTLTTDEEGKFRTSDIIEGSGPWFLSVMARGFHGSLVGRSIEWLRYNMREQYFKGIDEVNQWLQHLEEQMYWAYRNSNYYDMLPTFIMDGLSIGSPVTVSDEDVSLGKVIFTVPHFTENYLSKNRFGEDDVYHREYEMRVMQAVKMFDFESLSLTIQNEYKQGNSYSKHRFIMAIYSEDDDIFKDLKDEDKKYKPNRPWMQFYIEKNADALKKRPLPVRKGKISLIKDGYWSKPFSAWHYHRNPHETYARTPAWSAISDVAGNETLWSTMYEATEYSVRPAMWAMAEQKGQLRLMPGGSNWPLTVDDYNRPPVPIDKDLKYPYGMDMADRVEGKIERHFHTRLFQMIDKYNREHKQPPTAFQIFQMQGENAGQLGPAVQSFEGGLLKPIDDRMMEIERRAGRLPPIPDMILEYSEGEVDPQFTGPLSMSQKMFLGVQRVHNGLAAAEPIFNMWPETKYKVRASMLVEKVLEDLNFPQDCIVPEDEYQEYLSVLAQQEEEDRQLEKAERVTKMIPNVSKDIEPNSPIAALTGATAETGAA